MKLKDLIENIDKSEGNAETWICLDNIKQELDIPHLEPYEPDERMKCYWAHHEYCTDTWVGVRLYFLDDECVCVSLQPFRKSDEEFEWISKETIVKTREYIRSLHKDVFSEVKMANLEEDLGEGLSVEYASRLMNETVVYDGVKCEVLECKRRIGRPTRKSIKISHLGETKMVKLIDCCSPWRVKK